jgi:hypothetical protein
MSSMNYEERIAHIKNWFQSEITIRFNMPRDVDAKIAAMDVIEAINGNLPSPLTQERIGNLLSSITKEVSRSAKSRTLPTAKEFVDVVRTLTQTGQISTHSASNDSWRIDPLNIAIKRVRAGESLCESWLREPKRGRLLNHVTDKELEPYDVYIAAHTQ